MFLIFLKIVIFSSPDCYDAPLFVSIVFENGTLQ